MGNIPRHGAPGHGVCSLKALVKSHPGPPKKKKIAVNADGFGNRRTPLFNRPPGRAEKLFARLGGGRQAPFGESRIIIYAAVSSTNFPSNHPLVRLKCPIFGGAADRSARRSLTCKSGVCSTHGMD